MPRPVNRKYKADMEEPVQDELKPSRSAKKRASTALQKIGEQLAAMPAQKRNAMALPPELKEALDQYDKIKDHEGRRRQKQYIGRIMREVDGEEIARQLERLG